MQLPEDLQNVAEGQRSWAAAHPNERRAPAYSAQRPDGSYSVLQDVDDETLCYARGLDYETAEALAEAMPGPPAYVPAEPVTIENMLATPKDIETTDQPTELHLYLFESYMAGYKFARGGDNGKFSEYKAACDSANEWVRSTVSLLNDRLVPNEDW